MLVRLEVLRRFSCCLNEPQPGPSQEVKLNLCLDPKGNVTAVACTSCRQQKEVSEDNDNDKDNDKDKGFNYVTKISIYSRQMMMNDCDLVVIKREASQGSATAWTNLSIAVNKPDSRSRVYGEERCIRQCCDSNVECNQAMRVQCTTRRGCQGCSSPDALIKCAAFDSELSYDAPG